MNDTHAARCAVLSALHRLQGVGTAEAIRMTAKISPSQLSAALMSLEADDWIRREATTNLRAHTVYRLTPERRRARAAAIAD